MLALRMIAALAAAWPMTVLGAVDMRWTKSIATDADGAWTIAATPPPLPFLTAIASSGDAARSVAVLNFKMQDIASSFGSIVISGAAGTVQDGEALTIDRLESDGMSIFEQGAASHLRVKIGSDGGRIALTAAAAWSIDRAQTFLDDGASTHRIDDRARNGLANWIELESTLMEGPGFKWTAKGVWSDIAEGFVAHEAARPEGQFAIAGERRFASTRVKSDAGMADFSFEALRNSQLIRQASRLLISLDGIDLTLRDKAITRLTADAAEGWTSRSKVESASLDLSPALLMPQWHGALGEGAALVPQLVSLTLEQGEVASPNVAAPETLSGIEAVLSWTTAVGETTALFWTETLGRIGPGRAFEGSKDWIFDVSHRLKWDSWQIGAGVSVYRFESAGTEFPYVDEGVSGSLSLAYAPDDGPHVKIALGHDASAFGLRVTDYHERSAALSVSVSADLSPLVAGHFDRPEMKLTLEYRARLDEQELRGVAGDDARNALLLTFAAPL